MPTASALCFDLAASPGGIPSQRMVLPFCKLDATTDPGPSNDGAQRYLPGSQWFNTTTRTLFVCKDNAAGAAVWREVGIGRTIPARVATTASLDLSADLQPGDTVDGVTLAAGDVVLVKDQSPTTGSFSAGPRPPGSGGPAMGSGGALSWSGAGNILAVDGSYATSTNILGGPAHTGYLYASDFGFAIPTTATVVGIKIEWLRHASSVVAATTRNVRVVKGGSVGATELSSLPNWGTSDAYEVVGGPSDLCGETWAPADINATDFGSVLSVGLVVGATAYVDHCRITVYYTDAVGGPIDNGVYVVVSGSTATRHPDANTGAELVASLVYVKRGTVGAHTLWANTDEAITVGVDDVNYAQL